MKYQYKRGIAPIVLIVGVVFVLAIIGGGVGYVKYQANKNVAAEAEKASQQKIADGKIAALEAKLDALAQKQMTGFAPAAG